MASGEAYFSDPERGSLDDRIAGTLNFSAFIDASTGTAGPPKANAVVKIDATRKNTDPKAGPCACD